MASAFQEYHLQLVNKRTQLPIDDDTGKYIVTQASSSLLQTVYTDDQGTTPDFVYNNITQTMTNGEVRFWTASGTQTVDLCILTAAGQALYIEGLTTSQHRIEVDTEKYEQTLILPFYNYIPTPFVSASVTIYSSAGLGSIWSQGMALPAGSLLKECFARVETLGTGALNNFGVSGTPSGLIQQVTGSVTGLKWASGLLATANTVTFAYGTLLATATHILKRSIFITAATNIVFGQVTGTVLAALTGYVYVQYDLLPNRV